MRILFIGDIVGKIGRDLIRDHLPTLIEEKNIDFVIANGENASHGKGLNENHFNGLVDAGVDVVTLGNHYAAKTELLDYIDFYDNLLRPDNLHSSIPGRGSAIYECDGIRIRVTNLLGRSFMPQDVDNPFDDLNRLVDLKDADIHIVDFHAEANGEKYALGYAFDGAISALIGTHTHVQTKDSKILPNGTFYISDVGMCGPYDSVLGTEPADVVKRTWTGMHTLFNTVESGRGIISAVILDFDNDNKLKSFETIYKVVER